MKSDVAAEDQRRLEEGRLRGAERKQRALSALLWLVRESEVELKDVFEVWIDNARARRLLCLAENGLVSAVVPDRPRFEDVPVDIADRNAEYKRRLDEDHHALLARPDALRERVATQREVDALNVVLQYGHVQSLAMHALGADMVDVPLFLRLAASDLLAGCAPIANPSFRGVARPVVERMAPFLENHMQTVHRAEPWKLALQNAFFALPMLRAKTLREAVHGILDVLEATVDAPQQFKRRLEKHMKAAERVLRDLRTKDGKYNIVHASKPGRGKVTVWGAARRFAAAFGVRIRRESEERRDRKLERAKSGARRDASRRTGE